MQRHWKYLTGLIALGAILGATTMPLAASAQTGKVIPPYAKYQGKTYGEWSAEWWKWAVSLPQNNNPLFDTADVSTGQPFQHLWFLGGTFTFTTVQGVVVGTADRTCLIPPGTALFFPILNTESSTAEGNGTTEQELRASAKSIADLITVAGCELDGIPVDLGNDPPSSPFRAGSPLFTFGPLPDNNILNLPAGTISPSVSDGVYVLLAPLAAGGHVIHFWGTADLTSIGGPLFELDVTYHITIVPGKK